MSTYSRNQKWLSVSLHRDTENSRDINPQFMSHVEEMR